MRLLRFLQLLFAPLVAGFIPTVRCLIEPYFAFREALTDYWDNPQSDDGDIIMIMFMTIPLTCAIMFGFALFGSFTILGIVFGSTLLTFAAYGLVFYLIILYCVVKNILRGLYWTAKGIVLGLFEFSKWSSKGTVDYLKETWKKSESE